jgi:hypothetical protein
MMLHKECTAMTTSDLLALFIRKATEPPLKSSQMLVRHLQCKESLKAAQSLTEALDRFGGRDDHPLSAPPELLAPPM